MIKVIRVSISTALSLLAVQFAFTSGSLTYAQSGSSNVDQVSAMKKPEKAEAERLATAETNVAVITDPLVRVLISKGVLNQTEGRAISARGTTPGISGLELVLGTAALAGLVVIRFYYLTGNRDGETVRRL